MHSLFVNNSILPYYILHENLILTLRRNINYYQECMSFMKYIFSCYRSPSLDRKQYCLDYKNPDLLEIKDETQLETPAENQGLQILTVTGKQGCLSQANIFN